MKQEGNLANRSKKQQAQNTIYRTLKQVSNTASMWLSVTFYKMYMQTLK